jgi:RNA polymerase sigma-70 factor (ECF subfamily)
MAQGNRGLALRHIDTLLNVGAVGGLTDAQLLERFTTRRDEAAELAFAGLVERHGPMVLRVCRAILRDPCDAEDAFQATFLVLVRKARGLWVRQSLGPWLHWVALRTASCARSAKARRRRLDRRVASSSADLAAGEILDDLAEVLHEEVGRLPERYRAAVVLCLLEGLTPEQAARHLGWPVGTVHSRLARGRERLRDRLTRRGITPAEGPLRPSSPTGAATAVAYALSEATVRGVMGRSSPGSVSAWIDSLVREVLRSMMMEKFRLIACGSFSVAVLVIGASILLGKEPRDGSSQAPVAQGVAIQSPGDPEGRVLAKVDLELMQGPWARISTEIRGHKTFYDEPRPVLMVRGDGFIFGTDRGGKPLDPERVELHPKQMPKAIDLTPGETGGPLKGKTYPGIYKLEGDTLTLCLSIKPGSERPTKFATKDTDWVLDVYKRSKPSAP